MASEQLARYLDHAVLKPSMSQSEAADAIQLGVDYGVRTVCVRPADIKLAQELCRGTNTQVSCVLAFPHGTNLPDGKADEAKRYVDLGISEIDMVANYGLIRSGDWQRVQADMEAVANITRPAGVLLKVILETTQLNDDQIRSATTLAAETQADFVKTSTGFADGGASEQAVSAMLDAAGGRIEVKASGGIRDRERAELFVKMGCARLGVGYASTPAICDSDTKDIIDESGSY